MIDIQLDNPLIVLYLGFLRIGQTNLSQKMFPEMIISLEYLLDELTSKKAFSSMFFGAPMVGVPGMTDSTSASSITPLHSLSCLVS